MLAIFINVIFSSMLVLTSVLLMFFFVKFNISHQCLPLHQLSLVNIIFLWSILDPLFFPFVFLLNFCYLLTLAAPPPFLSSSSPRSCLV